MTDQKLQIIPLGGLGEFGMNMMALRCGDDLIVIDAGSLFPGVELLGVDLVVPDITYLVENRKHIRGLILTHGHEDHIGATPYVLSQLDLPIYATRFTSALVRRKLKEHDLPKPPTIHTVELGDKISLGCFEIELIRVTHSIPDAAALAIKTPLGVILHTADFKIDPTPIDGQLFDLHALADYAQKGVLLLLSDSTNVNRPGFTPSEQAVRPRLEAIFHQTNNSLYFSCFSSSIHRVQQIVDLSAAAGRKIAFVGRSISEVSGLAQDLNLLNIPNGLLINPGDMAKLPRSQRTFLISGSQGEPLSALSRAAVGKHRHAQIDEGDTVVLSTRVIPGNEKAIYRMVDHLTRRGAEVLYGTMNPPIHVSGHASEEELKLVLNLLRPKYFVPVHGEYRQLSRHLQLSEHLKSNGLEASFLLESGDVLEIDSEGARHRESVPVGRVCIDSGTGDEILEEVVIRDRRHLSEFGVIVPIVALNRHTGKLESSPEIVTRGFVTSEDSPELLDGAADTVALTIEGSSEEEKTDWGVMEEKIRADLRRYIRRRTESRPLIIPVILEV
ncbi:MAG: ribonuclease J [Solibacterales bacterium]|nr:ribonuclease J [Bryobacterales bacterium]